MGSLRVSRNSKKGKQGLGPRAGVGQGPGPAASLVLPGDLNMGAMQASNSQNLSVFTTGTRPLQQIRNRHGHMFQR